ncbi:MAG: response regulator [Fretibacterium sp.]|nr:response regulator [Fretibacterium sp.]
MKSPVLPVFHTAYEYYNVWIEASMLPFLFVLAVFLSFRYSTTDEVNRRFQGLTVSTFVVTLLETASTLMIGGWSQMAGLNLAVRTLYYAVVNINAYSLMRYIAAYVRVKNSRFDFLSRFLLFTSFVMLGLNLVPGISGFFFAISSEGGLYRGPFNTLCRAVYVFCFLSAAICLQLTHKQYYRVRSQYVVMNLLGVLLFVSFVAQYLFVREVLIVYATATVLLYIVFFYYEAPTYRQMALVGEELRKARTLDMEATRQLNASNRAKSDFLANTSHEVRTPMNAILGMNEMILKESMDEEVRHASLNIRRAGNSLLSIINNILDISKIESGKMELYNDDYHLYQLLLDVEDNVFETLQEKGLDFVLDTDKTLPEHLHGDEDRLRQIIINLVDNAVKYTEKGSVTLSVRGKMSGTSAVKLQIAIKDTGIGIREEDQKRLFETFTRVNLNETQNIQGAGLGLTLARRLLELMGGRIHLESEYGKGSTFTITLSQELAKSGFHGTIQDYEDRALQDAELEDEGPFICPGARLLVVDDTPVNLVVARGMLGDTKAQVDTAESGEECLEKLRKNHYDIVFLDHRMPGMDGLETLDKAREMGEGQGSVFIALTANVGAGLREEYLTYGFNDYLSKPMKRDVIIQMVGKYLPKELKQRA